MKKILAELDRMAPMGQHGKGPEFEKYLKRILEIAPEFRSQFKKVWLWEDYPDRRGADLGIDLVAENKQGERVAIQAKCYAPNGSLTWRELSTFYGDAMGRAEISQLMLVTTTDNLSRNARKQLERAEKPCSIWARSDLEKLGISYRTSLDDLGRSFRPAAKRFRPRRHQKTAINKSLAHLQANKRGQLLMACGTGKTLVGLWIREQMKNAKRTVVFVPSIALLRQTWSSWNQHSSKEFYSVAVCSDERATSRGMDALVSSPSAAGLPPTTNPDVIAKALDVRGPIVVFSTYQSSEVVEEAIKKSGRSFDLMIADEAHNTTSAGLTAFTRPLYDEHIPARRRLFLTATPRIVSKQARKRGEEEGYDIHSMEDTEVYGDVAYKLPFSEAIEKNLLTDYEIFVVGVDDADIAKAIRTRKLLKVDSSTIDGEELAAHVAIHRAMKKCGTRRMITFHSRIKQAKTFSKNVPIVREWLRKNRKRPAKVWGDAVSGEMPVVQRERVLARFDGLEDGECGIVSNARCLGEGVDVPTIDGISFVQPKRSAIDIVQAVGRAIRKSKKKEGTSTIILPVPILHKRNTKATIESSAFETVWRVLEALRAHDDVLAESLDTLRTKLGQRRGGRIRLPKLILDLPRSVNASFSDAIRLQLLEHSTESFWEGLGYLKAYKAEHGDCNPLSTFRTKDGHGLGAWVHERRTEYRMGRLSQERIDALEALGFVWDMFEHKFQTGLRYLSAYKAEHNDCNVSPIFQTTDGYALGAWATSRRGEYSEGRLSQERIDELEALGFVWDPFERKFQIGFGHLIAYKTEHGDCNVLYSSKTEDGYALGAWVSSRRKDYKKGKLSQERIDELEALGFVWSWSYHDERFQEGLSYLSAYKAKHGDYDVPNKFKTKDGYRLGIWVSNRRSSYKKGKLSQDRIDELEALGFIWDQIEHDFQEKIGYLRAYKAEHGDCGVPNKFKTKDGCALGDWVQKCRQGYRKGKLSRDRIDELGALGFVWDPFETDFQEGRAHLTAYKAEHGDCGVPNKFKTKDGYRLGDWVRQRRRDYRKGKLSQGRIEVLEAIGIVLDWDAFEEKFQEGFSYLTAYKAKHDDCRVPHRFKTKDGYALGSWTGSRRQDYKNGKLTQDRIEELEALGFVWDPFETDFQEGRAHLTAYKAEHGHVRVPARFKTEDGYALGAWLSHHRQDYKKGKLSQARIDDLNALGFIWDPTKK